MIKTIKKDKKKSKEQQSEKNSEFKFSSYPLLSL
jgi:hypothetical protein